MLILVIGHRGCGKTTFFSELSKAGLLKKNNYEWLDLDFEIEKSNNKSILNIFENEGEKRFRELEINEYQKIESSADLKNIILTLGAGFPVASLNRKHKVILLQRLTDEQGRIFLGRPRLNNQISALAESIELFKKRQPAFLERADLILRVPEGLPNQLSILAQLIFDIPEYAKVTLTLNSKSTIGHQQVSLIELRSDLLSELEIELALKVIPKDKTLLSIRSENYKSEWFSQCTIIDIDAQFKNSVQIPDSTNQIISSHRDQIEAAIQELEKYQSVNNHLKLCPMIENWNEFEKGYSWWMQDQKNRSFLPRSQSGRWTWYRLYMKGKQKLNFISEAINQAAVDQPSPWQWLVTPIETKQFTAILGNPVSHSRSPSFHQSFFENSKMPFFNIQISESEWSQAIHFLVKLGLSAAAVTSPLKKLAYEFAQNKSAMAREFKAVNTLVLDHKSNIWFGDNTDGPGLEATLDKNWQTQSTALWGGGGTLQMLQKYFPSAISYSSRTGLPRSTDFQKLPEILIWAAPRMKENNMPPETWNPNLVIDLNYAENSLGLEYAQKKNIKYISGLAFFQTQAELQQKFWKEHL